MPSILLLFVQMNISVSLLSWKQGIRGCTCSRDQFPIHIVLRLCFVEGRSTQLFQLSLCRVWRAHVHFSFLQAGKEVGPQKNGSLDPNLNENPKVETRSPSLVALFAALIRPSHERAGQDQRRRHPTAAPDRARRGGFQRREGSREVGGEGGDERGGKVASLCNPSTSSLERSIKEVRELNPCFFPIARRKRLTYQ